VIIYRELTGNVDTLAATLGVLAYYRQIAEAAKRQALQTFSETARGITVVATNALRVDINILAVQYVIHVDVPSMLRDYSQESRHTGRDRQDSKAVIITPQIAQRRG
jgi:superfamily II DNA helicase RecQ